MNALPLHAILSGENRIHAKQHGAYYTGEDVAKFLSRWSIRTGSANVLDPSFGGGVFLSAAATRLKELNPRRKSGVYGVELEPETYRAIRDHFASSSNIDPTGLKCSDFFAVDVRDLPEMDAIVGNPPFIRYQRFSGRSRELALLRAAQQQVSLPKLTSSWAPFVVHSVSFLRQGGRLAMVLPMELAHAAYARPVLLFLAQNFTRLHLLVFGQRLFPDLNEDTVLLLADGRRTPDGKLAAGRLHELAGMSLLSDFDPDGNGGADLATLLHGQRRLNELLIPTRARELYSNLRAVGAARPLGEYADVGIGYVSGNNDFFHPSPAEIEQWQLPRQTLRPAVLAGGALQGVRFTREDWELGLPGRQSGYLLNLKPNAPLRASVANYLEAGRKKGVPDAYKCRVREHWHAVPHVRVPHGFLTYMNGAQTRLVANEAGAVAPNTLHLVQVREKSPLDIHALAIRWSCSLTQLSVEIEGHALGGGMLKLEPTEAERVLLPLAGDNCVPSPETIREFDALLRGKEMAKARDLADELFLRGELGLSMRECALLRDAALKLRNRRMRRSPTP